MPTGSDKTDIIEDAKNRLAEAWGTEFRRIRSIICQLIGEEWHTVPTLIEQHAVSHKTVAGLLHTLSPWLESHGDKYRVKPGCRDEVAAAFCTEDASYELIHDRYDAFPAGASEFLDSMQEIVTGAPKADANLDHVSATAETGVKRAYFLHKNYDVAALRILFLGDHDLTSLALAHLYPATSLTVVDIDERLLNYIREVATERGWPVQTLFTDLRIQTPRSVRERFDLVFTDPPYTPAGVELFLEQGLVSLKQTNFSRILLSYGFGEQHPMLGLKVQSEIHKLRLAIEAILPYFNHYHGAQAVGSSSSLYICRPTTKTWPAIAKAATITDHRIYTHGESSEEAARAATPRELLEMADAYIAQREQKAFTLVNNERGEAPGNANVISLRKYIESILPTQHKVAAANTWNTGLVAINLYPSYGSYLLRILTAAQAEQLIIAVPHDILETSGLNNEHDPLHQAIESKFALVLKRFGSYSMLVATKQSSSVPVEPVNYVIRYLFDRQQAVLNNAWREALISLFQQQSCTVTKNQAREAIGATMIGKLYADSYLSELPMAALRGLVTEVEKTIDNLSPGV